MIIPSYIQVIIALALVIILFVIGFMIYNYEFLRSFRLSGISKQKVPIFTGIKDLALSQDEVYFTQNVNSERYRDLTPSYNQAGGIEYSYNFWLYVNKDFAGDTPKEPTATPDTGLDDPTHQTILFVKGSNKIKNYLNNCGVLHKNIMVKSPLVKLENHGDTLTVELNTLQGIDAVKENSPDVCSEVTNVWKVANAHKLAITNLRSPDLLDKWNMFTLVLQDTFPQDPLPYRNKVRCRIYLNTLLVLDKYVDGKILPKSGEFSTIKTNAGNLFIAPVISNIKLPSRTDATKQNQLMLGNMSYYNYAVTQADIDREFAAGVSKEAPVPDLTIDPTAVINTAGSAGDTDVL